MKANIFCNVCKNPLRAVKEWGKNEVDVYVIPCENCASQQSAQDDAGMFLQSGEYFVEYVESNVMRLTPRRERKPLDPCLANRRTLSNECYWCMQ